MIRNRSPPCLCLLLGLFFLEWVRESLFANGGSSSFWCHAIHNAGYLSYTEHSSLTLSLPTASQSSDTLIKHSLLCFPVWPITTTYLISSALSLASHCWNHLELVLRKCIQAQTCKSFFLSFFFSSISLHEEFMEWDKASQGLCLLSPALDFSEQFTVKLIMCNIIQTFFRMMDWPTLDNSSWQYV